MLVVEDEQDENFDGLDEQQTSDKAEAFYILRVLAYRSDGDWAPHYRAGHVTLSLLREAQDNPDEPIMACAMEELGLVSLKGKGKAIDVVIDGGEVPTNYTGVSRFSD